MYTFYISIFSPFKKSYYLQFDQTSFLYFLTIQSCRKNEKNVNEKNKEKSTAWKDTFDAYKEYIAIHTTFTTIEGHVSYFFYFPFKSDRNSFLFLSSSSFLLLLSSLWKNRTTRQWWSLGSSPSSWLQSLILSFVYIWWLIWSVYNRNCCSRTDKPLFSSFFLSSLPSQLLSHFHSMITGIESLEFIVRGHWLSDLCLECKLFLCLKCKLFLYQIESTFHPTYTRAPPLACHPFLLFLILSSSLSILIFFTLRFMPSSVSIVSTKNTVPVVDSQDSIITTKDLDMRTVGEVTW